MPKRMLASDLGASESLAGLSFEAEVTFMHLVSVADDFGRFDGRPRILIARLFPLREEVSEAALMRWIGELERAGLLHRYVTESGAPAIHLTAWEKHQRVRASEPKYGAPTTCCNPQPSAESCGELPQSAADCRGPRLARRISVSVVEDGDGDGNSPDEASGSPLGTVRKRPEPKRFEPPNVRGLSVETLPTETARALLAVHPRGAPETPETLAAWFAWVAPAMRLRGIKSTARAARKWWPNLRRDDVEKAIAWLQVQRIEAQRARSPDPPEAAPPDDEDFPPLNEVFIGASN